MPITREATIDTLVSAALAAIRDHEAWAGPIVFGLAFAESLALVSLLVPATAILLGVGVLVGASGIAFWPVWLAAVLGAALGDWASYWFGYRYQQAAFHIWPLSRRPDLLTRGERFFRQWGVAGIFLGRFFGPLRSVVPLVAGICAMPALPFQLANITSALVWATGILAPGAVGGSWFR